MPQKERTKNEDCDDITSFSYFQQMLVTLLTKSVYSLCTCFGISVALSASLIKPVMYTRFVLSSICENNAFSLLQSTFYYIYKISLIFRSNQAKDFKMT